ncbi:MAG TPA: hypothetical protein VLV29_07360 [Steroidobacteraceae bacterium]|nr:hypothetical protein [Steroidobacteraceae bacterium]
MREPPRRISSRMTFFSKKVLPLLWFGLFLPIVVGVVLLARQKPHAPPAFLLLLVPVIVAALVYALLRRLVLDLADEVYDEGDALRVRFGAEEERIPLQNIMNISYAGLTNPARATLTLRQSGRFGKEVAFSPVQRFFGPLLRTSNPIVTDLIERVDAARRR